MNKILLYISFIAFVCSPIYSQNIQLHLLGKDSLETKIIDSIGYENFHSNYLQLETEIASAILKIQKLGYINAEVIEIKKITDSLTEGILSFHKKYNEIRISYKLNLEEKEKLQNLPITVTDNFFIIPIYYIDETLNRLILLKSEKGEAFSSLQLTNIKSEDSILSATLKAKTSKIRKIDRIVIKGYSKFPPSFLKHHLKIKEGQIYNSEELLFQVEKIENLNFASQIKPPEILFTQDSTVAYFYLRKENSNLFEGYVGFSNSEENKLVFTGDINLQLHNNLNYGEKLNIRYKSDGNEQINFNTTIDLPYIFNSPLGSNLALDIFKQDSTYINIEQALKVRYSFNNTLWSYFGFKSINSSNLTQETSQSNLEDYKSNFYSWGNTFEITEPKNILVPVQTRISLDLAIGTRKSSETIRQQKIEFRAFRNFYLNQKNSIFIQNSSNILFSNSFLENELFRFGGINSVRGFTENSIRADKYYSFQTEYRYFLSSQLYLHSIIDFTYFENPFLDQDQQLLGLGFGMALNTKGGILKVNLANGSTGNESFQFSKSKIHLSLLVHF